MLSSKLKLGCSGFIFSHSIYFIRSTHSVHICLGSGRSCSYSSVGPPGGRCCTVCSCLAPAEVSINIVDLSPVPHNWRTVLIHVYNAHHLIFENLLHALLYAWHKSGGRFNIVHCAKL